MTGDMEKRAGPAGQTVTPESVVAYLEANKDFFLNHPALLAELDIPHREGEGVISLIQRQVDVLRQKHRQEQEQLHALIRTARDNERVAERLHRIAVEVLGHDDFDDALDHLAQLIKESFGVDHVSLRIASKRGQREELVDARSPVFADLYHRVVRGRSVCDNQLAPASKTFLFGGHAEIKSVVLIPLGGKRPCGILALGSVEENRFTEDHGTFYLDRLGELLGAAIQRLSSG